MLYSNFSKENCHKIILFIFLLITNCNLLFAGNIDKPIVNKLLLASPPSVTPAGPISFCPGGSQLLTVNGSAALSTFKWVRVTLPSTYTAISGATSATYTATSAGNYACIVDSANQGTFDTTNIVVISILPKPVLNISPGSAVICLGDIVTFTSTFNVTPGNTYAWSSTPSGFTASTASINISPSTNTTYQCIGTATNGCKDTSAVAVAVKAKPNASFT